MSRSSLPLSHALLHTLTHLLALSPLSHSHPEDVHTISRASQEFAKAHLTKAAALRSLRAALTTTTATSGGSDALVKGAAWREAASRAESLAAGARREQQLAPRGWFGLLHFRGLSWLAFALLPLIKTRIGSDTDHS